MKMNTGVKQALLALLLGCACAAASAGVISFDDLAGDESPIAAGYGGFDWDKVGVVGADAYPGSGYAAGAVSPGNVAYNLGGATAAISRTGGGVFDFAGAWFTSAWLDQELAFEGWRGGALLYSTDTAWVIDPTTPVWVGLGWSGIDTLVIYNSSGTQWAMDEFTVPEPASLALFGTALAGLVSVRRRRRPAA